MMPHSSGIHSSKVYKSSLYHSLTKFSHRPQTFNRNFSFVVAAHIQYLVTNVSKKNLKATLNDINQVNTENFRFQVLHFVCIFFNNLKNVF
jgi:hypothetical protein